MARNRNRNSFYWRRKDARGIVQLEGRPSSALSAPFSSRLSGLPVGFSIPIQRGASEPNYYDSSPLDSVGPFDLPPFSMIPRYLGRAHCVLPVEGDPRAADRYGGAIGGPRTTNGAEPSLSGTR